jgi:hypothetical protein
MSRLRQALLVAVLASAGLAGAEEPPYKRLLRGDEARKAAALQKRVEDLWAARKFAEAVAPAEELLALRKGVQGEGHWEAADAARWVRRLRQAAALPADKQASLVETYGFGSMDRSPAARRPLWQPGRRATLKAVHSTPRPQSA